MFPVSFSLYVFRNLKRESDCLLISFKLLEYCDIPKIQVENPVNKPK